MITVGDFIIQFLAQYGVRRIYGYPGAAILSLMDAIEKNDKIEWILMRNENAASLAASAEAKLTGNLAVCMSSSGPGATNLLTGMLDAHTDSAPVLAITGKISTQRQKKYGFQDVSNAQVFKEFCTFSAECDNINMLMSSLQMAVYNAVINLKCSHLAIASDIASHACPPELIENLHKTKFERKKLLLPPQGAFSIICDYLAKKNNPVIVVGARAIHSGSSIEKLAEKIGAPIFCTGDAKGIIRDNHPNFMGVFGIYGGLGEKLAHEIIEASKMIIAFGVSNVNHFVLDKHGYQKRPLLMCENNHAYFLSHITDLKVLYGPLDEIAEKLKRLLPKKTFKYAKNKQNWNKKKNSHYLTEKKEHCVHPSVVFTALNKHLKKNDIIITDIGDNHIWALQALELKDYQRVLSSENSGVMGFGLVGGIAANLARPEARVFAIIGDGGLCMYLGELATACQYKCPLTIIVLNNNRLQRVSAQKSSPHGLVLENPDFTALIKSFGADGVTVSDETNIEEALRLSFTKRDYPFLINVITSPDVFAKAELFTGV